MENSGHQWFTGKGPFSKINRLTTEIGMLQAGQYLGDERLIRESQDEEALTILRRMEGKPRKKPQTGGNDA